MGIQGFGRRAAAAAVASAVLAGAAPAIATEGPSEVVIIVRIEGGKDDSFDFTGALGTLTGETRTFTILTNQNEGRVTFRNVEWGAYPVTQESHLALYLLSIVCSNGSPADLAARTVTILVNPGVNTECIFTESPTPP